MNNSSIVFVLVLILFTILDVHLLDIIGICFPKYGAFKNYFPQKINLAETMNDDEEIYSVSNHQKISRPILAYLCTTKDEKILNSENLYESQPKYFNITSHSVEATDKIAENYTDCLTPNTTDAVVELCLRAANEYGLSDPRRFWVLSLQSKCSSTVHAMTKITIPFVPIHDNYLIAQGLLHNIINAEPTHKCFLRRIEFSVFWLGKYMTVFTNPIKIFNRIATLQWDKQPEEEMLANQPFSISLEIVDENKKRITSGLDSTLMVEVTIGYQAKTFLQEVLVSDFLYKTDILLSGNKVITSYRNYDQVLHKRAVKGFVEFNDVMIQDIYNHEFFFLNATLTVPRSGDRQPFDYSDFHPSCYVYFQIEIENFSSQFCDQLFGCKISTISPPTLKLYNKTNVCAAKDTLKSIKFVHTKITEQKGTSLKIIDLSQPNLNVSELGYLLKDSEIGELWSSDIRRVPYHVQIPGLCVVVVDNNARRIFSGADAVLEVKVITSPQNVSMSKIGRSFKTYRGLGRFLGAVEEIVDEVRFAFKAIGSTGNELTSSFSQPYAITNEIHIAMFGRFNTAGAELDPDPVTETFAKFAVEDIRKNISLFNGNFKNLINSNLTINLKSYDSEQNYSKTVHMFLNMIEEEQNLKGDQIMGIIAFGDNELTFKMKELVSIFKLPQISYREDRIFINKLDYKTMFSVDWNPAQLSLAIGTALQLHWSYLILIEDEDLGNDFELSLGIKQYKFIVTYRMIVGNEKNLTRKIEEAKKSGSKSVLSTVCAPKQYILYREAIRNRFAPMHGYQWLVGELQAKQFDWENKNPYCAIKPKCTEAFEGMQMLYSTHNLSDFSTDLWYHVSRNFFHMNHADYHGIPSTNSYNVADRFAMGYDAVLMFAYAIEKVLSSSRVITNFAIIDAMEESKFEGLTGTVRFDAHNRLRLGPIIALSNVVDQKDQTDVLFFRTNVIRWLGMSDYYMDFFFNLWDRKRKRKSIENGELTLENQKRFRHVIEIPIECVEDLNKKCEMPYKQLLLPNTNKLISNFYPSTCGYLSHAKLISSKSIAHVDNICLRTELKVPSYHCKYSCGGGRLSSNSAKEYKHGFCIASNECRCRTLKEIYVKVSKNDSYKFGYSGISCKGILCDTCYHGMCMEPFNCSCFSGWSGEFCDTPICIHRCFHGKCDGPNYCKCEVGYYGNQCNILLGVLIITTIICSVIIIAILIVCITWLKNKKKEKAAIRNLDWLVEWKDVTEKSKVVSTALIPMTSIIYTSGPESSHASSIKGSILGSIGTTRITGRSYIENTCEWKEIHCYVKKFDVESLNVNSLMLRTEIKYLREMKHPNIVRFIGACLTAPNVCILKEIVHKGSLFEILQTGVYHINWNFKFSILKDIAQGMDYIQKSNIKSHGHLTSKNCLIDNRWTCKVSGFGVPTLRKKVVENQEKAFRSMLWSAPELLRVCVTPSELGYGTKAGDVYSFGIILTEVCNHEAPFDYELHILSVVELIRLLKNFSDPGTRGIKMLLDTKNYDTSKPIRPSLVHSSMPEIYSEKKGIEDLIVVTTAEDPLVRPTYEKIITTILTIHPLNGELIENLIFMLEKYTNHLEDIFNEKVIEVGLEKNKTEKLIKRLLPSAIVEQLKKQIEVLPQVHPNVTFFFSDVVGFTDFAKKSKPMEVVEFLNDLYTMFDSIVESFNVYKLETIGDAYCVASGVPLAVDDHYEQIATMSLHMLSAITHFPISHMPDEKLRIRIGIHSGSCVAGVVGATMPKYCVFGEDVIIAQLMESHGSPNSIQISEATAKLLDKVGIYNIVYRAELSIMFIDNINAYWLLGKEGLEIKLPFNSLTGESLINEPTLQELAVERQRKSDVDNKQSTLTKPTSEKNVDDLAVLSLSSEKSVSDESYDLDFEATDIESEVSKALNLD